TASLGSKSRPELSRWTSKSKTSCWKGFVPSGWKTQYRGIEAKKSRPQPPKRPQPGSIFLAFDSLDELVSIVRKDQHRFMFLSFFDVHPCIRNDDDDISHRCFPGSWAV